MHTIPRVAASAVALATLVALSGCAGGGDTSGVTTITYTSNAAAENVQRDVAPLIEEFEKENPDIKVEVQTIPFNTYNTKLTTEFKAGGGPDILNVNHTDIQTFARGGFLEPLDSIISSNSIDVDALIPGLVSAGNVGGQQVTLPQTTDCRVLWVNPTLLASKGIASPPTTFDELVATTEAFAGSEVYGFAFPTESDYSMSYEDVGPLMKSAGGEILTSDSEAVAAAADSTGTVAAVELLQRLVATGATPPGQDNLPGATIDKLFAQGQLAMRLGGPWVEGAIQAVNPDLAYGTDYITAPVPVMEEGMASGSTAGGWHLGIAKNSDHKEAAGRLLSFLMQEDTLADASITAGTFPPTVGGLDQAPWSDSPVFEAFNEVLPNSGLPITPVPRMAEVSAAFEEAVRPTVTDESADVEEALRAFDDQTNSSILN